MGWLSYGRRGERSPRRRFRTGHEGFPLIRLLSTGAVVMGTVTMELRLPGTCTFRGGTFVRSSVRLRVCHKAAIASPVPVPSHVPASRQHILRITEGLCFWRHPSPQWLLVGCLLLREPLKVASFRMSICRDVRVVLYTGYLTSGVTYPLAT